MDIVQTRAIGTRVSLSHLPIHPHPHPLPQFCLADFKKGEDVAIMKKYHAEFAKRSPAAAKEYPYSQLYDDMRLLAVPFAVFVNAIVAGQLPEESMPKEKHDFTFQTFWPLAYGRFCRLFNDNDVKALCKSAMAGEYKNMGSSAPGWSSA